MVNNNYSVLIRKKHVEVRNIYAVGRNYTDHAKEMNATLENDPIYFQKSIASLSTDNTILIPKGREVHHELEVVFLIGKTGENISEKYAFDYVQGIGLGLDLTDRKLQNKLKKKSLPWFMSKSFKGSAVVSEFYKWNKSKWSEKFWLKKNNNLVQNGKIADMIFSIEKIISFLSLSVPLMEGDLLFTGTPSGVGQIINGDKLELGLGDKSFMKIDVIDLGTELVNKDLKTWSLYVDGAADLHSKTAGIGGAFFNSRDEQIYSFSEYLDDATNNEAEYESLIKGLQVGIELKFININIYSDSELIVKQVNGDYKVKNDRMKKLHQNTLTLLEQYSSWTINHIMREYNTIADKLSKEGRKKRK